MRHRLAQVLEQSHHWSAVCSCGHVAVAPNRDTAEKRHALHADVIAKMRDDLEAAKKRVAGRPNLKVVK